ncbi:hypothetical protein O181_016427 [Austropuccinia psidii MF-1]|uniref:Uncharacterized protein n=1 Tax=Austropuccinia psidii MF-1 TaxID=1389203 RepID=A0A9Q3GRN7_9BASI|nr:hypothetical protein [Austropuccinia psidii MF-1]
MVGSLSNIEESQHSCLPSQWKSIYPVFHISLLEPVKTLTIPNWHQEPPPPIIIEEEEECQDPERSTWEPTKNLNNCPEPIKDFHSLYPDKLRPDSSRA